MPSRLYLLQAALCSDDYAMAALAAQSLTVRLTGKETRTVRCGTHSSKQCGQNQSPSGTSTTCAHPTSNFLSNRLDATCQPRPSDNSLKELLLRAPRVSTVCGVSYARWWHRYLSLMYRELRRSRIDNQAGRQAGGRTNERTDGRRGNAGRQRGRCIDGQRPSFSCGSRGELSTLCVCLGSLTLGVKQNMWKPVSHASHSSISSSSSALPHLSHATSNSVISPSTRVTTGRRLPLGCLCQRTERDGAANNSLTFLERRSILMPDINRVLPASQSGFARSSSTGSREHTEKSRVFETTHGTSRPAVHPVEKWYYSPIQTAQF